MSIMSSLQMMKLVFWFLLLVTVVTAAGRSRTRLNSHSNSRGIHVLNRSGVKVDVFWVNAQTGELADSNTQGEGIAVGGDSAINSYVGHTFEVQELPNKHANRCRSKECSTAHFTVSENEDQVFTLDKNFEVTVEDHKTRAQDKAQKALSACEVVDASSGELSPEEQLEKMMECMERQIDKTIETTQEEIQFQASIRKEMGASLTDYICNDVNATTTKPVLNHTWTFTNPSNPQGSRERKQVRILFEAEMSKIFLVEDFISGDECQAIHEQSVSVMDKEDTRILPLSAKEESMDTVKVLLKAQSLINGMLGRKVSFGGKDPLFEIQRYHSVSESEQTCTASQEEGHEGSCVDATSNTNSNIHWVQQPSGKGDEDDGGDDDDRIFATLMVICQANHGAIHFPKTGVHVVASKETVGNAVLVVHRDALTLETDEDPYLDSYAICTPSKEALALASSSSSSQPEQDDDASMTLLVDRFAG